MSRLSQKAITVKFAIIVTNVKFVTNVKIVTNTKLVNHKSQVTHKSQVFHYCHNSHKCHTFPNCHKSHKKCDNSTKCHIELMWLFRQFQNAVTFQRKFQIAGWSCRDVTSEDVRLVPLISGRGKQCRLLGTVGVARGLGDHDLVVKSSLVNCKEFLSCQPEVRVKKIDELEPALAVLAWGWRKWRSKFSNTSTRKVR